MNLLKSGKGALTAGTDNSGLILGIIAALYFLPSILKSAAAAGGSAVGAGTTSIVTGALNAADAYAFGHTSTNGTVESLTAELDAAYARKLGLFTNQMNELRGSWNALRNLFVIRFMAWTYGFPNFMYVNNGEDLVTLERAKFGESQGTPGAFVYAASTLGWEYPDWIMARDPDRVYAVVYNPPSTFIPNMFIDPEGYWGRGVSDLPGNL